MSEPRAWRKIVALLTPFRNGAVDEKAFQSFVEWQVAES